MQKIYPGPDANATHAACMWATPHVLAQYFLEMRVGNPHKKNFSNLFCAEFSS